ncbi:MAG: hypothetical protein AAF403_03515, partial [Pseudomonadota bacterium]
RVCALTPVYAAEILNRLWNMEVEENKTYLLVGLGQQCSLVGGSSTAVFKEAPLHFSKDAPSNPKKMYSRYLIVIEMDNSNELFAKARYVGTAIPHFSGLIGLNDQLQDHYSNQK